MTTGWVKDKIVNHWKFIGRRTRVFVRRDYNLGRVVIDFMEGGSCSLYTYDGKWIAG